MRWRDEIRLSKSTGGLSHRKNIALVEISMQSNLHDTDKDSLSLAQESFLGFCDFDCDRKKKLTRMHSGASDTSCSSPSGCLPTLLAHPSTSVNTIRLPDVESS